MKASLTTTNVLYQRIYNLLNDATELEIYTIPSAIWMTTDYVLKYYTVMTTKYKHCISLATSGQPAGMTASQ